MSALDIARIDVGRLVNHGIERALVSALIHYPDLGEKLPDEFGLDVIDDLQTQWAFEAFTNVRARGADVTPLSVLAEIERRAEHKDARWFSDFTRITPSAQAPVAGWARSLLDLAKRRVAAVALGEEPRRAEDEIDEFALRDAEPPSEFGLPGGLTVVGSSTPAAEADPWQRELDRALSDVRAKLGPLKHDREARRPMFVNAVALLVMAFMSTVWLVVGLLPRNALGLIGAEPKAIKTWLGIEMAVAMATGTKVCGEFFAELGVAFYFCAEDQAQQVRNRIRAVMAGAGRSVSDLGDRLFVCPRGKFIDITRDEDIAWIVASVRHTGKQPSVIFLDPLRDISSAAEDKSDEMSPVMRRLRLLGELLGCTVVVVHHKAKSSDSTAKRRPGQQLRGSGAIHGALDAGIYLGDVKGDATRKANTVDVEIKGARGAGRFAIELQIEDDDNGEAVRATWKVSRDMGKASKADERDTADDDALFAFVRDLAIRGEQLSRSAIRDHDERPSSVPERRVMAALDRMIDAGRLRLTGSKVYLPDSGSTRGDS